VKTHDTHNTRRKTSDTRANVFTENLESQLFCLSSSHQQDTGDAVGDLRSVSTGSGTVAPLRERRLDFGKFLLRSSRSNTVVFRDGDLDAGGRRSTRSGGSSGRENESVDGEDLSIEETGSLSFLSTLLRKSSELIHTFTGDVEVCRTMHRNEDQKGARPQQSQNDQPTFRNILRGPSHRVLSIFGDRVSEDVGGEGIGTL